jgi:predicted nucleic acid-binding protein
MNSMNARTFVDTNVLLYAHDLDAEDKHLIAKQVLGEPWATRTGVLSTQVLEAFYVNGAPKLARPLTKKVARAVVDAYSLWCTDMTPAELKSAFQIEGDAGLSFGTPLSVRRL